MLVGGVDSSGTRLYETSPSGEYFEYLAMAIGARSQSSKTYLEKNFESFASCSADELIKHGVAALSAQELTEKNVSIGIVSKDEDFRLLSEEELKPIINQQQSDDVEMAEV